MSAGVPQTGREALTGRILLTITSRRDFDTEAGAWDNVPARIALARAITQAIIEPVPTTPGMHALDYGAGTGLITLGIQPHVGSIAAADSSPGMLAQIEGKIAASGLAGVRTLLLDLEREPPPGDQFGLIVSAMTMHHIENVPSIVAALTGMLRPGGWLAVADLDPDDGEFHEDPTGVYHKGFERAGMAGLFVTCGLEDVTCETAHTLEKPAKGKGLREFTVFLVAGRKPG